MVEEMVGACGSTLPLCRNRHLSWLWLHRKSGSDLFRCGFHASHSGKVWIGKCRIVEHGGKLEPAQRASDTIVGDVGSLDWHPGCRQGLSRRREVAHRGHGPVL